MSSALQCTSPRSYLSFFVVPALACSKPWLLQRAAALPRRLQNESPFSSCAQGKKALAKMQAGDYDEAAVRAKLEGILTSTPVSSVQHCICYAQRAALCLSCALHTVAACSPLQTRPNP